MPRFASAKSAQFFELLLSLAVGLLALHPLLQFVRVAAKRVAYPFELEWMEGAIVDHLRIVLSGQALYREPTLDFTPFIYVPGYYFVSAGVARIVGISLTVPRLVSLVSILGCFAVLGAWIRKETRSPLAALVATGLFAATYGQSSYWFDIARVDSLALLLVLSGTLIGRYAQTGLGAASCGVTLAAAALTKQVALALALPTLLYLTLRSRRLGAIALGLFTAVVGLTYGWLEVSSNGWFGFYAFVVPADHLIDWDHWNTVLRGEFWTPVAPMVLCALAVVFGIVPRGSARVWCLHAGWALTAAVTSYLALLHTGGYPNVLMPFHAAIAGCTGIVFAALWSQEGSGLATDVRRRLGSRLVATAAVAIQFANLPSIKLADLVPTSSERTLGQQLLTTLSKTPGPVWMVSTGFYPALTHGAPVLAHSMAFVDVFKSKQERVKRRLHDALIEKVRNKRYRAIVLDRVDGFVPRSIVEAIHENYHLTQILISPDDRRFWPKSGAMVRPDQLWVPNTDP